MAPKLSKPWKEPVIVENKPGANGHIGADLSPSLPPTLMREAGTDAE